MIGGSNNAGACLAGGRTPGPSGPPQKGRQHAKPGRRAATDWKPKLREPLHSIPRRDTVTTAPWAATQPEAICLRPSAAAVGGGWHSLRLEEGRKKRIMIRRCSRTQQASAESRPRCGIQRGMGLEARWLVFLVVAGKAVTAHPSRRPVHGPALAKECGGHPYEATPATSVRRLLWPP